MKRATRSPEYHHRNIADWLSTQKICGGFRNPRGHTNFTMSTAGAPVSTRLPSNVSPPPEVISYDNQSGVIAIITGFSLSLILLSACMKLYARKYFRAFWHDDITFALAVGFAIVQGSVVFFQIHDGLGVIFANLAWDQKMTIRKAGVAAELFYIVIIFLSKACCALFFLWLAPDQQHKAVAWLLVGASAVWVVTSLFVEGFRCPLGDEWPLYWQQCTAFFARWVYIGVFDMVIELALFATSFHLIWNRRIRLSSRLAIIGAFACRLPYVAQESMSAQPSDYPSNILLTILRLLFLNMSLTPENSAYWKSRVACTTQIAIGWSIFSCVIPYLRPLITAYERDGLSSKHGSNCKVSHPSSNSSKMEPRPPQRQPSFHHPDLVHTVGFHLSNQAGLSDGDDITRVSRSSGRSSGGIQKTVEVELKDHEPAGQSSTQTKEDTAAAAVAG
ncbi:hypothetical protein PMIN05_007697 [Paraphaeosphaeria minitans]